MRRFLSGIVLLGLLTSTALRAVVVENLYDTTVSVASRKENDRLEGLNRALSAVFVKVSSDTSVLLSAPVKKALQASEPFVQQYDFAQGEGDTLLMHVAFNHSQVNATLKSASITPMSKQRPLTLVWLAEAQGYGASFLSQETNNEFASQLEAEAQARGLPVIFPLFDLEDASAVSARDLWEKSANFIKIPSARYQSDSILVGRIKRKPTNKSWEMDWSLLVGSDTISWKSEGEDPQALMAQATQRCAKELQRRYTEQVPAVGLWGKKTSTELLLRVTDIKSVNEYAALTRYLTELEPVARLQVMQMKPSEMIVKLQLKNTVSAFKSMVEMDRHLKVASAPLGSSDLMLHYQWSS